jgi:hypothetical protein
MKHRVDSEDVDHPAPLPVAFFLSASNLDHSWDEIMAAESQMSRAVKNIAKSIT